MEFDPIVAKVLGTVAGVILTYLVGVLAKNLPALIVKVSAWLEARAKEARSNFTAQQLAIFDMLVVESVRAVEQKVKIGEIISTNGQAKKNLALDFIKSACESLDIPFDVDAADHKIEAAINQGIQNSPAILSAIDGVTFTGSEVNKDS